METWYVVYRSNRLEWVTRDECVAIAIAFVSGGIAFEQQGLKSWEQAWLDSQVLCLA
jgi:hypothetical protein